MISYSWIVTQKITLNPRQYFVYSRNTTVTNKSHFYNIKKMFDLGFSNLMNNHSKYHKQILKKVRVQDQNKLF